MRSRSVHLGTVAKHTLAIAFPFPLFHRGDARSLEDATVRQTPFHAVHEPHTLTRLVAVANVGQNGPSVDGASILEVDRLFGGDCFHAFYSNRFQDMSSLDYRVPLYSVSHTAQGAWSKSKAPRKLLLGASQSLKFTKGQKC